jgi:hypothetical protein
MLPNNKKSDLLGTTLLRNTAVALIVCMIPTIAAASSWSPTLLVNTEAFQAIDDGDGASDIELRFGTSGKELRWNVTDTQFEFDGSLEVHGTASGNIIHAQDTLTSSGGLVVEGAVRFNSTVTLNGVTYTFPFGDAASTGKILASDGAGNLSWTAAGATPNVFQTLSVAGQSDVVSDAASDTLTFAAGSNVTITTAAGTDTITIAATDTNTTYSAGEGISLAGTVFSRNAALSGTSLEVLGTASGRIVHAQDRLTSSGTLIVEGQVTLANTTSCTNLTTDSNGVLSCNNTDYITEAELTTEAHLETQITDVSNFIVETEIDTQAELESILTDATNLIDVGEINSESELEGLLADVTNVLTNNDNSDSLTEGSTNLYFTDERTDDRINALFKTGSGISLSYDDTNNTFIVNQDFSSGAQLSLSPEYAGAVYYGDGANNVGQMVLAYDSTNKENYYKWTSTVSTLQDYNISIRVKIPDEFTHWDGATPIQFRYRTNAASADDNQMDITMLDTAGSAVSLTGGVNFANTSWTTATITGPESAGTYTPGSYVTIIIAMQARTTNTGEAHAGFLNLNWATRSQ